MSPTKAMFPPGYNSRNFAGADFNIPRRISKTVPPLGSSLSRKSLEYSRGDLKSSNVNLPPIQLKRNQEPRKKSGKLPAHSSIFGQ